jgi:hypothetical protein
MSTSQADVDRQASVRVQAVSYFEDAGARAKSRKSAWNFLLLGATFCSWLALYFFALLGVELLHQHLHPGQSLATGNGFAVLMAAVSPLLGTFPIGLFVGNALVWLVPPARRILDAEARPYPGADFASAQRGVLRVAVFVAPAGAVLAVVGALLAW